MSGSVADLLLRTKFPYGGSELNIMHFVGRFADDEGLGFFPSLEVIAGEIRRSEKQTRRAMKRIVSEGWLTVHEAANRPGAKRKTAHYQVNLDKLREAPFPNKYCERLWNKLVLSKHVPAGAMVVQTPPADVTPPTEGRSPVGVPAPLPPASPDPSHGRPSTPPTGGSQGCKEVELEVGCEGEEQPLSPDGDGGGSGRPKRSANWYMEKWNDQAPLHGLALVQKITAERRKQLKVRAADSGFDWERILARIATAYGVHGAQWFTFDHLIKNGTNYVKLEEGARDTPWGERGLSETRQNAGQSKTALAMDELQELRNG